MHMITRSLGYTLRHRAKDTSTSMIHSHMVLVFHTFFASNEACGNLTWPHSEIEQGHMRLEIMVFHAKIIGCSI